MGTFRPGDRVTLDVTTGYVTEVDGGTVRVSLTKDHLTYQFHVSADLLSKVTPVLPTTPGSVVKDEGCYLVLSTSGEWGCPDHGNSFKADDRTQVIFDAGVSS